MNKRLRIVLIASSLAFFMEYSLRGINGFLKMPFMAIPVFLNYFFYLAIVEEFIGRFRLKDYQVWIIAQFFALLWQLVSVSGIYWPPFVLGINIYQLLLNNVIWWPTLQTVFALYIAHRLTPDIDRTRPLLNKYGIIIFFILFVVVTVSWRFFLTPPVTLYQFLVVLILTYLFALISYKTISSNIKKKIELTVFRQDKFLDVLAIIMVVFLIISFLFLIDTGTDTPHLVNRKALTANIFISPLLALALVLRRITSKKPISI